MLTSEQVAETQARSERWANECRGEMRAATGQVWTCEECTDPICAYREVAALLADRAEMQAEIERLQGVNQTYRILVEELREEIERLRAEYAQTLTTIATAISLTADIPNETAAALCRMCNRNLAALEGEA